ncbi:MAG: hypothetical protein HY962_02760 [Ignavibacteriae bacterium]|nr:hypothetical protein [Ignavibacteriota bacterium]
MKFFIGISALFLAVALFAPQTSQAQYNQGKMFLGPVLDLNTPIGFGAEFEVGVSPNIGIGGLIRYWGKSETVPGGESSWSVIIPQVVGYYHFMPGNQLDPYAGARLGYGIYNSSFDSNIPGYTYSLSGKSGIFLNAAGGVRYFFNRSIAVNGSLEFRIAGEEYVNDLGFLVGLDFTL